MGNQEDFEEKVAVRLEIAKDQIWKDLEEEVKARLKEAEARIREEMIEEGTW